MDGNDRGDPPIDTNGHETPTGCTSSPCSDLEATVEKLRLLLAAARSARGPRAGQLSAADSASREADRLLLKLTGSHQISVTDLARATSQNYSTISMRLHRARQRHKTTNQHREITLISGGGLLLDMDGTLVDSQHVSDRCWADWCQLRGQDLATVLALSHGRQALDVMRLASPQTDPGALQADAAHFVAQERHDTGDLTALPGARTLLDQLIALEVPHALVTSADRQLAETRMAVAGLPMPAIAVCGDDILNGKPEPDGYLQAAAALHLTPNDCIVIEDSTAGVTAGRSAGAQVLGVGSGIANLTALDAWVATLQAVTLKRAATITQARFTLNWSPDPALASRSAHPRDRQPSCEPASFTAGPGTNSS